MVRFSSPNHTVEQVAVPAFIAAAGSSSQAKLGARTFANLLKSIDHSGFDQASVLRALADSRATEQSVHGLLRVVAPEYRSIEPIVFRVEPLSSSELRVESTLDFGSINQSYHKLVPADHSSISEAYLLALIQQAYESTFFAARLDSEVSVPGVERAVHAATVSALVARCAHSEAQIDQFQNLTLQHANAIRESINSGSVPFADLVRVLDRADKFRKWLQEQPENGEVVQAFYRETVRDTWIEKLPGKAARWAAFTGLGIAADAFAGTGGLGTAAGAAVGAVDSFIAEKLLRGWKPHMFIEKELRPILEVARPPAIDRDQVPNPQRDV